LESNFTFSKIFVSIPFQAFKVSFLKKSFHSLSALVSLILFYFSQAYCFLIFVQGHFPSSLDFQAVFFLSNFDLIFLGSLHQLQAIIKLQAK
jgi:hypothetical protein